MQVETTVKSIEPWNRTGMRAVKGTTYRFDVPKDAKWKDGRISCGPDGFFNLLDPFRLFLRVKEVQGNKARYFTLIGTIGETLDHAFIIGNGCTYTAQADGEFYCFANDASRHYGNNEGSITVTITQL